MLEARKYVLHQKIGWDGGGGGGGGGGGEVNALYIGPPLLH